MANQRAATISLKQLESTVGKAVKAAADKHGVQFEQGSDLQFIANWQILGRILRNAELAQAETVATEITASVNHSLGGGGAHAAAAGANFEPVVLWNGRHVICGARPLPQVEFGE